MFFEAAYGVLPYPAQNFPDLRARAESGNVTAGAACGTGFEQHVRLVLATRALGQSALYCVTEVHSAADIDRLADALAEVTA